ncbi:MBL fold metallo-hydrolase [Sphingosinicella terrae]|uniref:MBL fold metallo-hydrolase n=1 Tax=Sphingosinicella terrae TaxID=2172047 RepID=UPI000E0CEF3B|nr:MBL fold metallo-hydrolase [Sphingosinicella terrae]
MRRSLFLLLLALPTALLAAQGPAPERPPQEDRWITLGTRGGPIASPIRSQPANLLLNGGRAYLIDAGDGTAGQLAKAGVPANRIQAVFVSHLHFDHTAGLAGLLGLRWQTNAPNRLRIYGPPGTAALVDGLLASMVPGTTAGYGVPGTPQADPRGQVEVTELRDGATVALDGMTIRARSNSHYSFAPGSDLAARYQSLSLRFDLPGRSIVYTGDTGPSAAVEALARGADLLVAEMMDVEDTIAKVRLASPDLDPRAAAGMEAHLRNHHLLPGDVGRLAAQAGVGAVVVTHFVGAETGSPAHLAYLREIAEHYDGPVVIANDLEGF